MDKVGIVGWGSYVPRFRIKIEEIARIWGRDALPILEGLGVDEKAIAGSDEDTITMSVEAGRTAILRAGIDPVKIAALFIGSESHPYAVNPSSTVVSEALGFSSAFGSNFQQKTIFMGDLEFACKAGSAGMQICHAFVKSNEIEYGMAIGADTAQGKPGDALEYTAGSGAAAFILGKDPIAELEGTYSFGTDTSDFWRNEGKKYPNHGARFTGEPAYFKHVLNATKGLMEKLSLGTSDFDKVVFHTPNAKFPQRAAKLLGFDLPKLKDGLIVPKIGNTYSGASLLGLASVLDSATPGERILVTSYGSGSGSDSFSFVVTNKILQAQKLGKKTIDYINNKKYVDYGTYVKLRGKLLRE